MSLAATVCAPHVGQAIDAGETGAFLHGPTFMGNPLACSAALASLDLLASGAWSADVARIEVIDKGLGIDPADLPRLFTRFGRLVTRDNSHIPGTGLGLYLARELARMHGGDITVKSAVGSGSTFTLELPLTEARSAASA